MKLKYILFTALCGIGLTAKAQSQTFTRNKVLVEKYTGLNCPWCPNGDTAVEGFLSRHPEHQQTMVEMRHNSFSTPDRLTVRNFHSAISAVWDPEEYPQYYIDRCSTNEWRSDNPRNYGVGWSEWNDKGFDPISRRLNILTNVSLELEGSAYDPETRELTIYAHGDVTAQLPDLCINVFLVQDLEKYANTSRASMTLDLNGDPLPVYDGKYNVTYRTTLPESYGQQLVVPEDMKAIVFVASRFAIDEQGVRDFTYSEVHNTDIVALNSLPTTPTMPKACSTPNVTIGDGKVMFTCDTPGALYNFTVEADEMTTTDEWISFEDESTSPTFVIKAYAFAGDLLPSEQVSVRFSMKDLCNTDPIVSGISTATTQASDATIYTLSGKPVPGADTRTLMPGLYIVGGKKVVVK